MNRAILSRALLAAAAASFAAAAVHAVQAPAAPATPAAAPWKAKNLQILPADMPRDQVIAIMKNFSAAMGKDCSFCHSNGADGKLDPAADTNKHKQSARWMMKMVRGLNEQFGVKDMSKPEVTCYTCHRGSPHPLTAAPAPGEKPPEGHHHKG